MSKKRTRNNYQGVSGKKGPGRSTSTKGTGTKVRKAKKEPVREVLTKEQKKDYERYIEEYGSKSVNQLKELLAKNRQIKSGNKKEVVERVAECKALGGLPNCPKCIGGKLKFNMKTGDYYCKGFMDDDVMKNCSYKSESAERTEWVD